MRLGQLASALLFVAAVAALVPAADASFPGRNGRIVFVDSRSPLLGRPQLESVSSTGKQRRKLSTGAEPETQPAVSPNGRWIAFLRSSDLFVMRSDGTGARKLAVGRPDGFAPAWSPTGNEIAFAPEGGGIAVVPSRGGTARLVTSDGTFPTWAPDGARLAFERDVPGPDKTRGEVHVVRADGSGDAKIFDGFRPVWSPRAERIAYVDPGSYLVVAGSDGTKPVQLGVSMTAPPAWSPDGTRIAFTNPDRAYAIFVADASGTGAKRLTSGQQDDLGPIWSPTGEQVAFLRSRSIDDPDRISYAQLWVIDAAGRRARRITHAPLEWRYPGYSWTKDARRIVYAAELASKDPDVYAVQADDTGLKRLTANFLYESSPRWSPDGTRIAFTRYDGVYAIYVMRADGSGVRKITSPSGLNDISPSWSPDGRSIAFVRTPQNSKGYLAGQVYVVDTDGTRLRRIGEPNEYGGLAWSPDGTHFAFTRWLSLYTMRADGSDVRQVGASSSFFAAAHFAWSPDGRRLAASLNLASRHEIDVVNVDGTGEAVLVPDVDAGCLAWSPDGREIAFCDSGLHVEVVDIESARVRATLERGWELDWQALR